MIERGKYGSSQPEIAPPFLYQIPVPNWENLQTEIEKIYLKSKELTELSKIRYAETQSLLLSELGLLDWQPKHTLAFTTDYANMQRVERIDADYFQPKYDDIISAIKSYPGGWDTLENLVTHKKCVEVGSKNYLESGIPFVRVSNLSPFEITQEKYISEELYAKIKEYQPEKGEILLSKDATPGIAYHLRAEPEKMIPAGGILRLTTKTDKIGKEYLTLVLNSLLTQEQINRDVGGSVILHWRPDQVAGTVIPILHQENQTEIKRKVIESFNLRKRAKDLLEHAKRAVEIAIEAKRTSCYRLVEFIYTYVKYTFHPAGLCQFYIRHFYEGSESIHTEERTLVDIKNYSPIKCRCALRLKY